MKGRVDAHGHPHRQCEDRGGQHQFQRCRKALGDQVADRALVAVGNAEFALRRAGDEACELGGHGGVQAKLFAQILPLFGGGVFGQHAVHRVADEAEHGEGDQGHGQHDQDGLDETPEDEGCHGNGLRMLGVMWSRMSRPSARAVGSGSARAGP